MSKTITITKPMVLIPLEKYEELLREAGEKPTPLLSKEIARARKEFRERKTVKWQKLKKELGI
jgi:PHD/YefM family antitoxin component YafN of YafNO toxin-antitoxin module